MLNDEKPVEKKRCTQMAAQAATALEVLPKATIVTACIVPPTKTLKRWIVRLHGEAARKLTPAFGRGRREEALESMREEWAARRLRRLAAARRRG